MKPKKIILCGKMFTPVSQQKGISLIELLIATALSAIVLTMAISIYISSKKNYQHTKSVAQEDIKVLNVQSILYDAIENSGLSCKYGTQTQKYINRTTDNLSDLDFIANKSAIRFGDIANISSYLRYTLPAKSPGLLYQGGSDYIMVKNEYLSTVLTSKPINYTLNVDHPLNSIENDYLAICNNDEIDIAKTTTSNTGSKIKLAAAPLGDYNRGDYVGKFGINIYYIADTGEKDDTGEIIYGLFIYSKNGSGLASSHLLVDDVSDLKISLANTYREKLRWKYLNKDIDLNDVDSKALRITFKIRGEKFEKVILLK